MQQLRNGLLVIVKYVIRSVLDKGRHFSVIGVGIHDYTSAPFVRWEHHDGLVLFTNTNTYHTKMSTLIYPYQLLNKDPTDRLTRKLSEKLLTLKRSAYLSEAVYNKIKTRHKQPPRIYGSSKIHKANVHLRHIVSCVN